MLPFGAEPPAHVIETCAHRSALMCRELVIDDNASSGKSGPQRQAGNANERCLKAVGQGKRKLDSLFGVALNIDVNHHGCERHRLFRLAAIKKRARRPFRLVARFNQFERI